MVVNATPTASRSGQPGITLFIFDTLGLRVALPNGLYFLSCNALFRTTDAHPFRLRQTETELRNLLPQSAYRQRLFLSGSGCFRALLAQDTLSTPFVSSLSLDGRTGRPYTDRHALRTFMPFTYCVRHAVWGAIDVVRPGVDTRTTAPLPRFFPCTTKAIPFFLVIAAGE